MEKLIKKAVRPIAAIAITYVLAPFALFDLDEAAYPFDEDHRNGVIVAYGPKPWFWVSAPFYHSWFYDGNEWPFVVFEPFCRIWVKVHKMEQGRRHYW